jgi:pimeloyl-ACP methyl ester carboxylesterase
LRGEKTGSSRLCLRAETPPIARRSGDNCDEFNSRLCLVANPLDPRGLRRLLKGTFLDSIAITGRTVPTVDPRKNNNDPISASACGDAVNDALARFETPPVVIAHSLGALLAQRLLGQVKISGPVMLAPVPPEGMLFITSALFASAPAVWVGLWGFLSGETKGAFSAMADVLFSKHTSLADRGRHASKMVFESARTILEAYIPMPVLPAFSIGVPTLVIAGAEDALISSLASVRTAIYHGSEYQWEDELGHLLQIGPGASRVAASVIAWLDRSGL